MIDADALIGDRGGAQGDPLLACLAEDLRDALAQADRLTAALLPSSGAPPADRERAAERLLWASRVQRRAAEVAALLESLK